MSGGLVRRGFRSADREAWQQARAARRQLLAKVRARRRLIIARAAEREPLTKERGVRPVGILSLDK
jgi:hypothetical protein